MMPRVAVLLVLTQALALATAAAVAGRNLSLLGAALGERLDMVIFLKEGLDTEGVGPLRARILSTGQVRRAEYESKEEALREFSKDPELAAQVRLVESNPLPASLRLRVRDTSPSAMARLAAAIGDLPGVESVRYGLEEVARYQRMARGVQLGGSLLAFGLGALSLAVLATVAAASGWPAPAGTLRALEAGAVWGLVCAGVVLGGSGLAFLALKRSVLRLVFCSSQAAASIAVAGAVLGSAVAWIGSAGAKDER